MLFGVLYWIYRNRERLGGGDRYARDPVCGMQVEMAQAPASRRHGGQQHYFCSDRCAERFDAGRPGTDAHIREAHRAMQPERIIERLDGMVAAGRITAEEASHLRATVGTAEFDVCWPTSGPVTRGRTRMPQWQLAA